MLVLSALFLPRNSHRKTPQQTTSASNFLHSPTVVELIGKLFAPAGDQCLLKRAAAAAFTHPTRVRVFHSCYLHLHVNKHRHAGFNKVCNCLCVLVVVYGIFVGHRLARVKTCDTCFTRDRSQSLSSDIKVP